MKDSWTTPPSSDKLMAPSATPADRLVKWLNHLSGRSLNDEEKNHLILSMTGRWVKDIIKQIGTNTPLPGQLEVYQDCLAQIDHVAEKVAYRAGGVILSDELLRLQELSKAKIAEIQPKLRSQQIEASQELLTESHTYALDLPATATAVSAPVRTSDASDRY